MAQIRRPVKIRHSKLNREAVVPAESVKHWQQSGWQPVEDKAAAKSAEKKEQ